MIVAGIDYSMSSPAICIIDTEKQSFDDFKFYNTIKGKKYSGIYNNIRIDETPANKTFLNDIERYSYLAKWTVNILNKNNVDKVILEGYAMNVVNKGLIFNIAENTAILKYMLLLNGYDNIYTPAPKEVKKFFTGRGNADKHECIETFETKHHVTMRKLLGITKKDPKPIDDLVDASAIAEYGITLTGE